MTDYTELKKAADAVTGDISLHAYYDMVTPEITIRLIEENRSLKGSCKALGEKTVRRKMQQLENLKKENAQLRESIAIKEEFKANADRFGEAMEIELKGVKDYLRSLHRDLSAAAEKCERFSGSTTENAGLGNSFRITCGEIARLLNNEI